MQRESRRFLGVVKDKYVVADIWPLFQYPAEFWIVLRNLIKLN